MTDATAIKGNNEDRELTQYAVGELKGIPEELRMAELNMANIALDLRHTKADLAEAEMDAQINCVADAKNAEGRKLQLEQAAAKSPEVQALRLKLVEIESIQVGAEAAYNDLHRRYRAALAITELQTAKISYLARFDRQPAR